MAGRARSLVAGLLSLLMAPLPLVAQYSAADEQAAIDAVTSFLIEMGETKSA